MAIDPSAVIHESAYVDEPCEIGPRTRIWHFCHVLPGTRIGADCILGQNVMAGPDVVIGDGCKVQNNVALYRGVTLERDVFCGPSCVFTNVLTPRAHVERKSEFSPTHVGRGATIGANATIVCGHTLGEYCMVAAGAVVTKDVPPYALVAGVPARQIGWVSRAGERLGADLICPRTGERYELVGGRLRPIEDDTP
ncbi:acyltransferase [Meinhardsimonia xiamenensis]|nr:acyltransferase [Meinhardsimonia xiamenensis]